MFLRYLLSTVDLIIYMCICQHLLLVDLLWRFYALKKSELL